MAEKNIQIRFNNGSGYDALYPRTKMELVDGLPSTLDEKVTKEAGKGLSTNDFSTVEKNKLAGLENYVHPTTAGNKHIPTGGATGDVLGYASSGTATWKKLVASDIPSLTLSKISDAGTSASRDTGTSAGNVPLINAQGKLDDAVIPKIAITDTFVVTSEAQMLSLTVEVGDVAIRNDISTTFILRQSPGNVLANWERLSSPSAGVESVAGKTGVVTLVKGDVGLGSVENYGIATQAEAQAGTASNKYVTPQRVKQAIDHIAAPAIHQHSATDINETTSKNFVTSAQLTKIDASAVVGIAPTSSPPAIGTVDIWFEEITV